MKLTCVTFCALTVLGLSAVFLAQDAYSAPPQPATASSAPATSQPVSLNDTCPGLSSSGLAFAKMVDLPKGTVLKAGDLTISEKEIADEIAKAPKDVRDQLKKNAFFIL